MRYFYSLNLQYHWNDISMMVEENYSHEYDHDDVLVMAVHHHHTIEEIKNSNPGHKKIIIYQLEPLSKNHWWSEEYIVSRIKDADEVWDYDLDNIEVLKGYGIDAKFRPFLYTDRLKRIEGKEDPDIDVLFYGTSTKYRSNVIETLTNCGLVGKKTVWLWNFSDQNKILDEFIGRSKIILDLPTNEENEKLLQKQTRIYYALINGKCVVSQKSFKNYFGDLIVEVEKDEIQTTLDHLLEDDNWRQYSNVSDKFKHKSKKNMLELKQSSNKNKLAVFYHVYQANEWKKLYQEQINSLIVSGLYDACDFIHIGINGDEELPFVLDKMKIQYNENKILEANTLQSLWEFCRENIDYSVMYFHTKGITRITERDCSVTSNAWRIYLEYFVIHNWKECIKDLDEYDCAGAEWTDQSKFINQELGEFEYGASPHYAGNFWWANASYIQSLDIGYIYNEDMGRTRWKSELWIGTKNPKFKSYHKIYSSIRDITLYEIMCSPDKYIDKHQTIETPYIHVEKKIEKMKIPNKDTKIVMISMFKNESKTIGRMLESCYRYIDYWILQDNGSTDGTPEVVNKFFKDKDIPGFIYNCEEGWVGFGWNRDHLLQTCLKTDHGCDWILKMDCDEYLEVDDDFDWSLLNDTSIQSFHITAENPGCVYYRAWMWNARLPWHFKHDVAHECIVCDLPDVGEGFERFNLPRSFRQIGTNDGESYTVPTKYVSDSLKLEEQHIREGTLLEDLYHFWYVGKSYHDACGCNVLPLKERHQREYARRAIFYFKEYLNYTINYDEQGHTGQIWEMGYYTLFAIGELYRFLGDYENAIDCNLRAEPFCPVRNEHIVGLAECYRELGDFEMMKTQTERLVDPERKLPFPDFYFLVNSNFYIDSGDYGKLLHQIACENYKYR